MTTTVKVYGDPAGEFARRTAALMDQGSMLARAGGGVARLVRSHFRKLERERPNAKGWPRSHFWIREGFAKTAFMGVHFGSAIVRISSPAIAQKIYGGEIRPKHGMYLAIPIDRSGCGVSPRARDDRDEIFVLARPGKNPLLVKRLKNGGLKFLYVLVTSVRQDPDPDTLPTDAEINKEIFERTGEFLALKKGAF